MEVGNHPAPDRSAGPFDAAVLVEVAGAPQNPDGTINLIEYAAWLAKEEDDADQSE